MRRILSFLFVVLSITAEAQLKFKSYTSFNEITSLLEVGDNIWVGSTGGITLRNKSTGALVTSYTTNDGLSNNYIKTMTKGIDGSVWVSTNFGICKFVNNQWTVFAKNTPVPTDVWFSITDMTVDIQGILWITTVGKGIYSFDGTKWQLYKKQNGIASDSVYNVSVDQSGNKWFGTQRGVNVFDGVAWQLIRNNLLDTAIAGVYVDPNDVKWFTYKKGLGITRWTLMGTGFISPTNFNTGNGIAHNQINDVVFDATGRTWLATMNGISWCDFSGSSWTSRGNCASNTFGNVRAIIPDIQGYKWFGNNSNLTRFIENSAFGEVCTAYKLDNSLSYNIVNDAIYTGPDTVKFVTPNGSSTLSGVNTWLNDTSMKPIKCVVRDISNHYMYGTEGRGMYFLDWSFFPSPQPYLPGKTINSIAIHTTPNQFWLARNDGLTKAVYNGGGNFTFTQYTTAQGLPSNMCRSVSIDAAGNVWVATNNGIAKYNGTSFTVYKTGDGLIHNNTFCVKSIGTNIWIGAENGMSKFENQTTWKNYGPAKTSGLTMVQDIIVDGLGLIWIASLNGGLIITDEISWQEYHVPDGLTDDRILKIIIDPNTKDKWILTLDGVSRASYTRPDADFTFDTICYESAGNKTAISNASLNTDKMTKYSWKIISSGTNYNTKDIQHDFTSHGKYAVQLIAKNYFVSDTLVKDVIVGSKPNVSLIPSGTVEICDGKTASIKAVINNKSSIFKYQYSWSSGNNTDTSILVSTSDSISVSVSNIGCSGTSPVTIIKVIKPYDSTSICLVSTDPLTGKNRIVWDRYHDKSIVSYNVYKEIGSNYIPIGNVGFNEVSQFIDYNSIPEAYSHSYAISAVDSCGNESKKSFIVKTINLLTALSPDTAVIGLSWTPYVDGSGTFTPNYYYIYKGKTKSKLVLFDSVSSSVTQYNDLHRNGAFYYQIAVKKPNACAPAILKAEAGPYAQSLSNIAEYKVESGISENELSLNIFPNPVRDILHVQYLLENNTAVILEIINETGNKAAVIQLHQASGINQTDIDLSQYSLSPGMYLIRVIASDKISLRRVLYLGK